MQSKPLVWILIGSAAAALLGAGRLAAPIPAPTEEPPVSFSREVRPIIVRSCLACHGFDPSTREAGLRLDTFEHATAPRTRGREPAIIPGDPDASLMMLRVAHPDPDERMPPEGEPLKPAEIETLRRWIALGAEYEPHWSLRPVAYAEPPAVGERDWERNPIDAFIRARQLAAGLDPAPLADRRTLLRRVTFDLTGLPPTPEELDAFLADDSPDAYARVVDRLLASPAFGERWARHWLDLMRYAETYAHEFDYEIRHAYQFRDYVIRALNADVPYDQLVTEHLAGDIMPEPRRNPEHGFNESIIGTSFWWLSQGTHGPVDVRIDEADRIDNQIDVMGKAFLATTISCARCHDHKFDPIYTKEYYSLAGFVQSSRRQEAYLDPDGKIRSAVERMQALDTIARDALKAAGRDALVAQTENVAPMLLAAADVLYGTPGDGEQPLTANDATIADFDSLTWDGWEIKGDAFTDAPTPVSADPLESENTATGAGFANTHRRLEGDGSAEADARTGSITSDPFTIKHDYIRFLIGGGNHPGKTGIRLLVDGKPVRDATGNNALQLVPRRFDVAEFKGREARIEIFDEVTGGWGNIRVDQIVASDEPSLDRPARRAVAAVATERSVDAGELRRWVRALQAVDPANPHHPVAAVLSAAAGNPPAHADQPDARPALFDFAAGVTSFADWFKSGWAFNAGPTTPGQWLAPASHPAPAVLTAVDSGALSPRLTGTLRSPTFEITSPYLAVLAKGRGTTRVIIDGFTMDEYNALLFGRCKLDIDAAEWSWHVHDTRKYVGHRAHFEIIDDSTDSSFAVARAVWLDEDRAPAPLDWTDGLEGADAESLAASLQSAVADAARGDASSPAGHAALAWLVEQGFIEPTIPEHEQLATKFAQAEADCPYPMRALTMEDGTGEDSYVHTRGDYRQHGEDAPRAFIAALCDDPTLDIPEGSGRLQLAEKLLDESNPLPARVMVNRVWHHLFGRGIVETTDDFGLLGKSPTHPELLDHLAWRFRNEMGWSIKALIREIVTSRTYRLASGPLSDDAQLADPRNQLLTVRDIRRLDGESVRDAILATSGRLDPTMYGPSVPIHLTRFMTGRGRPGESGPLDGNGRRSVYIEVRRNFLSPMMQTFDAPNPHSTIGKRSNSNVPAQSLILLNDPFVVGQSALLANRVAEEHDSPEARVAAIYNLVLSREPTDQELAASLAFLQTQAETRQAEAEAEADNSSTQSDQQAWADLCHVVYNLKEFVFLQ